jgi:hypothetical protein
LHHLDSLELAFAAGWAKRTLVKKKKKMSRSAVKATDSKAE